MISIKKFITLSFLIASTSTLFGCATTYHRGDGIIIAEKRIKDKNYKSHQATETGAVGGAVGGGLGYAVDVTTPGAGVYEFTVKLDNEGKPLTITQYTTPIPLHTPVYILEKNNLTFIKQK